MRQAATSLLRSIVFAAALAGALFILPAPSVAAADADGVPITEAAPPEWLEQRQDASSFTYDWLIDLDNGEYEAAATSYTVDGDKAEGAARLRELRAGLGKLSSREYRGATVIAVATDDSEHQVSVAYASEFSGKTVVETVLVLLWHRPPAVLSYTLKEE